MKKIIYILSLGFVIGCSDSSKELGQGYFLKLEGKSTNEILNKKPNINGILPDILRYDFDSDFIIAEQRPNEFDDVMHEETYKYDKGRKELYYWIIIKEKNLIIGPLDKQDFENEKNKNKVNQNLKLKSIWQ